MNKSDTDLHWNERALRENDDARVNIADTVQRDLELALHLRPAAGRGAGAGGRLRQRLCHAPAARARAACRCLRLRREHDRARPRQLRRDEQPVLPCQRARPERLRGGRYDAAVCVRVLINLRDAGEQANRPRQHRPMAEARRQADPGGRLHRRFDVAERAARQMRAAGLGAGRDQFLFVDCRADAGHRAVVHGCRGVPHRHVRFPDPGRLSAPGRAATRSAAPTISTARSTSSRASTIRHAMQPLARVRGFTLIKRAG